MTNHSKTPTLLVLFIGRDYWYYRDSPHVKRLLQDDRDIIVCSVCRYIVIILYTISTVCHDACSRWVCISDNKFMLLEHNTNYSAAIFEVCASNSDQSETVIGCRFGCRDPSRRGVDQNGLLKCVRGSLV